MGVFLYGTYLFIKSSVRTNKTFIKTIPNYMEEYQEWYDDAYKIIKDSSSIAKLFKDEHEATQQGELNISI